LRLESAQNATDHARCVAARLTGDAKPYDGLPWFWSDQGPHKLQIAGLTTGYDQVVVRGDRGQGAFSAFCYKAGQLVGIESVNRAGDHMFGRRLLPNGSITPEQAACVLGTNALDFLRIGVQDRKEKTLLELEPEIRWKHQPGCANDFKRLPSAIRFAEVLDVFPVEFRRRRAVLDPLPKRTDRGFVPVKPQVISSRLYVRFRITITTAQPFDCFLQGC